MYTYITYTQIDVYSIHIYIYTHICMCVYVYIYICIYTCEQSYIHSLTSLYHLTVANPICPDTLFYLFRPHYYFPKP